MEAHSHYLIEDGDLELNAGRRTVTLVVANTGDRPVQAGSHAHFFEVNRALRFERAQALGMRLDIPAGTATRFEPGQEHTVTLVEFAGARRAHGMNSLVEGDLTDEAVRAKALDTAIAQGFILAPADNEEDTP